MGERSGEGIAERRRGEKEWWQGFLSEVGSDLSCGREP